MNKVKTLISTAAALAVLLVVGAQAQEEQKESPPPGGTPKDFNLPEKTTFTLDNGLQATLVPYGALPKVTARVVIRMGNVNEEADQVWLIFPKPTKTFSSMASWRPPVS